MRVVAATVNRVAMVRFHSSEPKIFVEYKKTCAYPNTERGNHMAAKKKLKKAAAAKKKPVKK